MMDIDFIGGSPPSQMLEDDPPDFCNSPGTFSESPATVGSPDDTAITAETINLVTESVVTPWQDVIDEFAPVDPTSVFYFGADGEGFPFQTELADSEFDAENVLEGSAEDKFSESNEGATGNDLWTLVDPTTVFPDMQQGPRWSNKDTPDLSILKHLKSSINDVNKSNTSVDNLTSQTTAENVAPEGLKKDSTAEVRKKNTRSEDPNPVTSPTDISLPLLISQDNNESNNLVDLSKPPTLDPVPMDLHLSPETMHVESLPDVSSQEAAAKNLNSNSSPPDLRSQVFTDDLKSANPQKYLTPETIPTDLTTCTPRKDVKVHATSETTDLTANAQPENLKTQTADLETLPTDLTTFAPPENLPAQSALEILPTDLTTNAPPEILQTQTAFETLPTDLTTNASPENLQAETVLETLPTDLTTNAPPENLQTQTALETVPKDLTTNATPENLQTQTVFENLPTDLTTNAHPDVLKTQTSGVEPKSEVKIKQEVIEVNNNDSCALTNNPKSNTTNVNTNSLEKRQATNLNTAESNDTIESDEVIKPKRKRFGYKIRANRGRRRSSGSPARPMPAELTRYLNLAPISGVNKDTAPRPVPIHVGTGQKAPVDYTKMMEDARRTFPVAPLTKKPRLPAPQIPPVHMQPFHLPSPRLLAPAQTRIQAHFPPVPVRVPQPQQEPLCLSVKPQQQQQPVITVPISPELQLSIPITPELLQKLALPAFANLPITPETLQQVAALAALSTPPVMPQIPMQQPIPQAQPTSLPKPTPVMRESIRQQLARPISVPNVLGNTPIQYTVPPIRKPSPAPAPKPAPTPPPPPPPKHVRRRFSFPSNPPTLNPVALSLSAINNRYSDDPPTPSPTDRKPPLLMPASPYPSSEDSAPPTPSPSPMTSPIPLMFEETGQVYRCDDCFRTFKHRLSLTNHQRSHGNKQPHLCFICKEPFKYKTNLKRHLRIHARQMRMCKYCHSIMESDYDLVQHEKEHRRVMAAKDAEAKAAELEATLINGTFLMPGHAGTTQFVKQEPDSTTNA